MMFVMLFDTANIELRNGKKKRTLENFLKKEPEGRIAPSGSANRIQSTIAYRCSNWIPGKNVLSFFLNVVDVSVSGVVPLEVQTVFFEDAVESVRACDE